MKPRLLGALLSLQLMCSCATQNPPPPRLPADVALGRDAGRGADIFVMLRLDDGESLPFIMDTGAPITIVEKSQESKLGERLDTGKLWNFGFEQESAVYPAPRLYLGNTPLLRGSNVATFDRKKLSFHGGRAFAGVLGMDVLQHYCIQLDFAAGKMRFLDDQRANKKNWGKPFPLSDLGNGCPVINENLVGTPSSASEIDTGCDFDGWLTPKLFQQWTNQAQFPANGETRSPKGILAGETYQELDLHETTEKSVLRDDAGAEFNGIGLHLLSRNLVTFDFPSHTLYLKRTRTWPLIDKDEEARLKSTANSAADFLSHLHKKGRLPGWSKKDQPAKKEAAFHFDSAGTYIFDVSKKGDLSIYHYQLTRTSKASPWQLQKAWRTDQNDHLIEAYPTP
ncbi:MAG TPA: hypothetical protein VH280_19030 [Verrucomicrobiae bacterium]|nr:hypothetical protein [Verrucomicrobiae bacterium]